MSSLIATSRAPNGDVATAGPSLSGERQMWCAVLTSVVVDLCQAWGRKTPGGPRQMRRVSLDAVRYIGTRPSRDFRMVCAYAGVDADAAHERMLAMTTWPEERLAEHRRRNGGRGVGGVAVSMDWLEEGE